MRYARKVCNCVIDVKNQQVVVSGRYYDDPTRSRTVVIPMIAWMAMERGELIQNAMPNLSSDDWEFLISGYSPEGWEKLFGGDK